MSEIINRPEIQHLIETKAWDELAAQLANGRVTDAANVLVSLDDPERDVLCKRLSQHTVEPSETPSVRAAPPYLETPYASLVTTRVGWLVLLMIGQMFTATIIDYFDEQLEKALVLALFIPMVIASGGNSGSQTATLLIRAMALGEVKLRDWRRVIYRESLVGILLGAILGIVAFSHIALFSQSYGEFWRPIAVTLGLTTVAVVLFGSFLGSFVPLIMRLIRTDPAKSSTPFVATLADVGGLIIYFLVAILILKGTIL